MGRTLTFFMVFATMAAQLFAASPARAGGAGAIPSAATTPMPGSDSMIVRFRADADARIEAAAPDTNFGAATLLMADRSPQLASYMRFSVQGLSGSVESATLRVYASNGSTDGPAVYGTRTDWSETGITWNSGRPPRISSALEDKAGITTRTWVEYSVSGLVTGNGTYGFEVAPTSGDGVDIHSREAPTNTPELVVTTSSADDDAPTVTSVVPAAEAVDVAADTTVRATFSEAMDAATLDASTFRLAPTTGGTAVAAAVAYDAASRVATLDPSADLAAGTSYTATVTTGATDLAGNGLAADRTWSFTTGTRPPVDTTAPETTILDGGPKGEVTIGPATIDFFSDDPAATFTCLVVFPYWHGEDKEPGEESSSSCASPVEFSDRMREEDGDYTFRVFATDAAGNSDATPAVVTWTVVPSPSVQLAAPANGAVDVSVETTLQATFSREMDPATLNSTSFRLETTTGASSVAAAVAYDAANRVAMLDPNADLAARTSYTAIVTTGAKDIAGHPLAHDHSWSFTTGTPPPPSDDTTAPETRIDSAPDAFVSMGPEITFSSDDRAATFKCRQVYGDEVGDDEGEVVPHSCTSPYQYFGEPDRAPDGNYTFYVFATDAAGNSDPTPATASWIVDGNAPTVTSVVPAAEAVDVAADTTVRATFSEAMDAATLDASTFRLAPTTGGTAVAAAVAYDAASRVATLDPSADLAAGTSYTATVTTGATDLAGNGLAADRTWSFTTAGPSGDASGIERQTVATAVNATAANTITIPKPEGTVPGDVLVACVAANGSNVTATGVPAGWSRIAAVTTIANPRVFGYYKVAGTAEPGDYRWALTASIASGGGIARYSGVSTVAPLDTAPATAAGPAASKGTVPGVTTASAGAMLVGCMAINSSVTTIGIAPPSGLSEAWDIGGKRHALADGLQPAAGPSGDNTWTFTSSREWAGWLVALRPG